MSYQALATPEAGAYLTEMAADSANRTGISPVLAAVASYERPSFSLIPAGRNRATEAFGPLWLAPPAARIVAVGRHNFLPIAAVAWISDTNQIVVAVDADRSEVGCSVLIRVWSRYRGLATRSAVFERSGSRALATVAMGEWDGLPVAGLAIVSLIAEGEEK